MVGLGANFGNFQGKTFYFLSRKDFLAKILMGQFHKEGLPGGFILGRKGLFNLGLPWLIYPGFPLAIIVLNWDFLSKGKKA